MSDIINTIVSKLKDLFLLRLLVGRGGVKFTLLTCFCISLSMSKVGLSQYRSWVIYRWHSCASAELHIIVNNNKSIKYLRLRLLCAKMYIYYLGDFSYLFFLILIFSMSFRPYIIYF